MNDIYSTKPKSHKVFDTFATLVIIAFIIMACIAGWHHHEHPSLAKQLPGQSWRIETYINGNHIKKGDSQINIQDRNDATISVKGKNGKPITHDMSIKCGRKTLGLSAGVGAQINMKLVHQKPQQDTFKYTGVSANDKTYPLIGKASKQANKIRVKLVAVN